MMGVYIYIVMNMVSPKYNETPKISSACLHQPPEAPMNVHDVCKPKCDMMPHKADALHHVSPPETAHKLDAVLQ